MCYFHKIDSTCAEYVRPLTDRDRRNPSYKARLAEILISDVSVTDGATWFDLGRSPLSMGVDLAPGSCGTRYPITASTREFLSLYLTKHFYVQQYQNSFRFVFILANL